MIDVRSNARPYGEEPVNSGPLVAVAVALIALLIIVGTAAAKLEPYLNHAASQVERSYP